MTGSNTVDLTDEERDLILTMLGEPSYPTREAAEVAASIASKLGASAKVEVDAFWLEETGREALVVVVNNGA